MNELADFLKEKGLLEKKENYNAFCKIDRADFVLEEVKKHAYEDFPLSIGSGQTISQPQVVAFMLHLLSPKEGDNVLDIGFGSGWTTALLAEIVKNGKVIGIEKIKEVYEFGKKNIEKYNFIENGTVKLFLGDGKRGMKKRGPYDCILISAADKDHNLPLDLRDQLKEKGRIVLPIGSSIFLFTKEEKGFKKKEYPGFVFVPLV